MINVTIIAKAQEGKGKELADLWNDAGKKTLASDEDCKSFVVSITKEDSDQLIVTECYTTVEALDAHNNSDLAKEALPLMMPLMAGPPTVHVCDVVG